jgi:HEAT repeat protein
MGLFGGPNVDKLAAKRDLKGLAKALTNSDPDVRESAGRALAEIDGDEAVHAIAERLDGQQDEAVIESGAGALRAMGDRAAAALLRSLRESPDDRKPLYGALLGRLGAQHGLAPLLDATHDGDPTVRGTAAFGLALIDDPEAPKRIIAVFQTDDDMDARGLAAMALGAKKLPGAYETFVEALDGDDALGRALGATGLGMLEDARAVPRLQQVADLDDDERVRNSAHSALADLQKSA